MNNQNKKLAALALIAVFFIIIFYLINTYNGNNNTKKTPKTKHELTEIKIQNKTVISLKNKNDKAMMKKRKSKYGVDKSLDMIVKSDEKVNIEGNIIDMKELENQERVKKGEIVSEDLVKINKDKSQDYGFYIVKKNDNLWDIHFMFLKEMFMEKGITLSKIADEPNHEGFSSGIGKILKFSEKMVRVYSLKNKSLSFNLNYLEPKGKIIIYKMNEIQSLIKDMNEKNINTVSFDGKNLWLEQ